jgi:hypothetical protein
MMLKTPLLWLMGSNILVTALWPAKRPHARFLLREGMWRPVRWRNLVATEFGQIPYKIVHYVKLALNSTPSVVLPFQSGVLICWTGAPRVSSKARVADK